eukprot:TRINITY_DN2453_c0_g1_i2.p1 TRINITY_DN2453_c0_g1~~TRINITY_DN2453_c0_g1_i2.p1  ORF type:complete len:483 (+),score=80.33 TRINITY_DN2453_c0_g1_i2:15-1463(+)
MEAGVVPEVLSQQEVVAVRALLADLQRQRLDVTSAAGFWLPASATDAQKRAREKQHNHPSRLLYQVLQRCRQAAIERAPWLTSDTLTEVSGPEAGIEWWWRVHGPGEYHSTQLHCDRDEVAMSHTGVLATPSITCVLYLSTHGNPTLVLDQRMLGECGRIPDPPSLGFVSSCVPGQVLVFGGNMVHTVLPDAGLLPPLRHTEDERWTCIVNLWGRPPAGCKPLWPLTNLRTYKPTTLAGCPRTADSFGRTVVGDGHRISLAMDLSWDSPPKMWEFPWPAALQDGCQMLVWRQECQPTAAGQDRAAKLEEFVARRRAGGMTAQEVLAEFDPPEWARCERWDHLAGVIVQIVDWRREIEELLGVIEGAAWLLVPREFAGAWREVAGEGKRVLGYGPGGLSTDPDPVCGLEGVWVAVAERSGVIQMREALARHGSQGAGRVAWCSSELDEVGGEADFHFVCSVASLVVACTQAMRANVCSSQQVN